jgi:hypothetical protein
LDLIVEVQQDVLAGLCWVRPVFRLTALLSEVEQQSEHVSELLGPFRHTSDFAPKSEVAG